MTTQLNYSLDYTLNIYFPLDLLIIQSPDFNPAEAGRPIDAHVVLLQIRAGHNTLERTRKYIQAVKNLAKMLILDEN